MGEMRPGFWTVATVLLIGAENGCLIFATADREVPEFDGTRISLIRNGYGGFSGTHSGLKNKCENLYCYFYNGVSFFYGNI